MALTVIVMLVVSPFAAAIRTWRRRSRGDLTEVSVGPSPGGDSVELTVDCPTARVIEARRCVTEAFVHFAQSTSKKGAYHMVYREPVADESVLMPIGPQLQAFGDRFHQALAKSVWRGMRIVWLCLPRTQALAELIDEHHQDPAGEEMVSEICCDSRVQWAIVSLVEASDVGEVIQFSLVVPDECRIEIEKAVVLIRRRLTADDKC
ncbi:MAG: hypothetical protein GY906_21545 [bacterium]|nr:hypothetical protein [bacterium]